MSKKNVLHLSFSKKAGNYGDYVLTHAIRKSFEQFSGLSIEWKTLNIFDWEDKDKDKYLKNVDMILIGGGGLFMGHGNSDNNISGWHLKISNEVLDSIDIPIVLYTVGFNYFWGQEPNELFISSVNKLLQKSIHFSLRHKKDVSRLSSYLEKDTGSIEYVPCNTTIINNLWGLTPNRIRTKRIAINVPFDKKEIRYGKELKNKLMSLFGAVKELEKRGYSITVLFHAPPYDVDMLKYLILAEVNYDSIIDMRALSIEESFKVYQSFDLVIGGRGHAQMIPFGLSTPFLSLYVHDKIKFFLEEIDKLKWLIDLNDVDKIKENIISKSLDILENKEHIQEEIELAKEPLLDKIKEKVQQIGKTLRD